MRAHRDPVKRNPLAGLSILAVVALVTAAGLPAYGTIAPQTDEFTMGAIPGQSFSSTGEVIAELSRDGYQVTRALSDNLQPFAHLADTFTNNPNSPVQWPFIVGVPISSGFGYRECAGCSSDHQGLDFNPGEGTPIQSIADGTVVGVGGPGGSFGVVVTIEHLIDGVRIVSLYAHMLEDSSPLTVGQHVTVGQLVGQVGNTGQSTGAHLHFGLLVNGTDAIDPYPWLKLHAGG